MDPRHKGEDDEVGMASGREPPALFGVCLGAAGEDLIGRQDGFDGQILLPLQRGIDGTEILQRLVLQRFQTVDDEIDLLEVVDA